MQSWCHTNNTENWIYNQTQFIRYNFSRTLDQNRSSSLVRKFLFSHFDTRNLDGNNVQLLIRSTLKAGNSSFCPRTRRNCTFDTDVYLFERCFKTRLNLATMEAIFMKIIKSKQLERYTTTAFSFLFSYVFFLFGKLSCMFPKGAKKVDCW